MNLGRYIMDIRNKELKNTKEFIMRHAIATFIFVASIAGFGGFANALPIANTTGTDASKSVALDQGANQWNHFSSQDKYFRGGNIRGGSIALDQGANQWNHFVPRGGFSVALDQGANEWNHFVPRGGSKLALDQGANQWNHRGDDDWGCNPRRVL